MNYKETIYDAWQFTQNNKKLIIWYGFFPAILTTIVGILYVTYQILAFQTSPLFNYDGEGFIYVLLRNIYDYIINNFSISLPLMITALVLAIIYLVVPTILQAAIIDVIARRRHKQSISLIQGVNHGLLRFLVLFEYSFLIRTFSFIAISAEAAFILRNFGLDAFQALLPVIILVAIVGLILHLFFTFTEFYIVIDKEGVMSAILKSCTLVITHLQYTFTMVILMLIIGIRIVVQIVLVIIIPAILITGFAFFASTTLPEYAIIIIASISGLVLLFASYLAAVVHVFAMTVWTFTFLEFTDSEILTARHKTD